MSREELERLDDQGMSAWDTGDAEALISILADDFVWNDVSMPEPIRTREAVREYVKSWRTAFPDMRAKMVNRVVGDDSVAVEVAFTGTNTGPMDMGGQVIPPTGRPVDGRGTYFARFRNGEVIELNTYPDIAGMMMQLGLMPGV
jgi:steroid delta-isomerase-like uncharacterized protein